MAKGTLPMRLRLLRLSGIFLGKSNIITRILRREREAKESEAEVRKGL
jgi:hypothetical protein